MSRFLALSLLLSVPSAALAQAEPKTEPEPKPLSIALVANALFRMDSKAVFLDGDPATRVDDRFHVRKVEADLRGPVHEGIDGVAIIGLESERPGEYELDPEEIYLDIRGLPLEGWAAFPLESRLRVGRFRIPMGHLNALHLHDLPNGFYGLAVEEFLGDEGYKAEGLQVESRLARLGTWTLTSRLHALSGGASNVADDPDVPVLLGLLELAEGRGFNLALGIHSGGVEGGNHQRHARTAWIDLQLEGGAGEVDFSGGATWYSTTRSFLVGEDVDLDGVTDYFRAGSASSTAWAAWVQAKISSRWALGLRADRVEELVDDRSVRTRVSAWAGLHFSRTLRIRLVGERTTSDLPDEDGLESLFVELNAFYGDHPPHAHCDHD